jgi:5-methylcytosine-specific restriction enzyme subunit McrC
VTQPLHLTEYGEPSLVRLSDDEARLLHASRAGIDVRLTSSHGFYEVRASHFVGTVVLPQRPVYIRPKVSVEHLAFMLGFSPELIAPTGAALSDESPDVVTLMKHVYSLALGKAVKRGLLREYADHEEELVAIRGRVNIKDVVLRRFGRLCPTPCNFQDYDVDREVNRRLLAAALMLARVGSRVDSASNELRRLAARFDGVTEVRNYSSVIRPLPRDRILSQYDPALSVAETVLRNATLEAFSGDKQSLAFVVDMNRAYERFVTESLRQSIGVSEREWVAQRASRHLDKGRKIPMRPDISWLDSNGRTRLIIEVKYKWVDQAVAEDVQQTTAYCVAERVEDAVLVYAECPDEEHVVGDPGVRIHQTSLPMQGTVEDIRRSVDRLAGRIARLKSW